ncbi:MAG: DUF3291 domain-containing protein [Pseudomonadota bacterium]
MTEKGYQLAQINVGRAKGAMDDPIMKGFVDQLDHINRLADNSPGFVWRLQTENGDATAIQAFDDPRVIVNMSVWASYDALKTYVYSGEHLGVLRQRKDWFEKMDTAMLALWWVPAGHQPTPQEGRQVLERLQTHGPSPEGFTFAKPYPAPELLDALK